MAVPCGSLAERLRVAMTLGASRRHLTYPPLSIMRPTAGPGGAARNFAGERQAARGSGASQFLGQRALMLMSGARARKGAAGRRRCSRAITGCAGERQPPAFLRVYSQSRCPANNGLHNFFFWELV